MSQVTHSPKLPPDVQEQFDSIEQGEKIADWFLVLMIPATILLWIIGGIFLLS